MASLGRDGMAHVMHHTKRSTCHGKALSGRKRKCPVKQRQPEERQGWEGRYVWGAMDKSKGEWPVLGTLTDPDGTDSAD
jgi:hypothetical protein